MASGHCPADFFFAFSCFVRMLIWQRILYFQAIRVDDMHIESYQFGKIVVDGVSYSSDVVILGSAVQDNWRRIHGHLLSAEDLESVIEAKPSVLVVGCGAYGVMKVPRETRKALLEDNIQLEALKTGAAVERFNELSQAGANVAAALHLTC
jgi:hypothetical protein